MKLVDLLPFKKLTNSQQATNLQIFRVAGRLVKSHSKRVYGNKKARHFRRQLFTGKLNWKQHSISQADYDKMMKAHHLEETMLCAYAKAITKHASRWHLATGEFTSAEDFDYFQTACMAFVDALYGYTYGYTGKHQSAKFMTYMWWVLRNRMITFVAKHGPLGSISVEAHLLIGKIETERAASDTPLTADDLATRLNVSVEEIKIVEAAMVAVMNESQIHSKVSSQHDEHERDGDYTAEGRAITTGQATNYASNRDGQDMEFDPLMRQAINECPLSPFEREVLTTSILPYHGWQAEVARKHVNPRTNQPYSRMAPAKVLPKVQERVREYYEEISKAS